MLDQSLLNIAGYFVGTRALGPGLRSVIWFQGCPFHCEGCYSPDWIPDRPAHRYAVADMAKILTNMADIEGLTISGGEPFLQYTGMYSLLNAIKKNRPALSIIVYTGYRLHILNKIQYIHDKIFPLVDVIIDGNYIENLNDGRGLRGSSNQKVNHLTQRYLGYDFEGTNRKTEIHLQEDHIQFIGIPDKRISSSIEIIEQGLKV